MKKFYIQALNYDRSVCLNDHYAKVVRYRLFRQMSRFLWRKERVQNPLGW